MRREELRERINRQRQRDEKQTNWTAYRLRIVPSQLESARRKVAALENEARRLGLLHLVGEQ